MWIRIAAGAATVFLAAQLIRPEFTNPPATADLKAPADVKQILRRSCYACHSNEGQLPWFDQIVPAYQLVVHDVKSARKVLNFSELASQSQARQRAVLVEAVSQIQLGAMPLARYTRLHPQARVTAADLVILRSYLQPVSSLPPATRDEEDAADAQYRQWISGGARLSTVPAAPNGMEFVPDYKNWKAISSTDRSDTNTLKMILGNPIAIQAIADGTINPWPNGTAFAKVSWRKQRDEDGVIRSGKFEQVAFMIKNSQKYASTVGWGWAQWMGSGLKPFGSDAGFAQQCVACHLPLRGNDYVFTAPIPSLGDSK